MRLWISRTFPIVLVDELQDCKGGQVEIIRSLASSSKCIAAGDKFQDLDGDDDSPALDWAEAIGEVIHLDRIFRTDCLGLLLAAGALRNGNPLPQAGQGIQTAICTKPKCRCGFHISEPYLVAA